jgi:hypothetical protein
VVAAEKALMLEGLSHLWPSLQARTLRTSAILSKVESVERAERVGKLVRA